MCDHDILRIDSPMVETISMDKLEPRTYFSRPLPDLRLTHPQNPILVKLLQVTRLHKLLNNIDGVLIIKNIIDLHNIGVGGPHLKFKCRDKVTFLGFMVLQHFFADHPDCPDRVCLHLYTQTFLGEPVTPYFSDYFESIPAVPTDLVPAFG